MNIDKFDVLLFSSFLLSLYFIKKGVRTFETQILEVCKQLNNAELLTGSDEKE